MTKTQEAADGTKDIGELIARYERLVARQSALKENKSTIEAELAARQRNLKKIMDEVKEAGYDPDNLQEEILKNTQVVELKLDTFEAELEAGEKIVDPMLKKIRED